MEDVRQPTISIDVKDTNAEKTNEKKVNKASSLTLKIKEGI